MTQDANGQPQSASVVTLLVTPEQAQELVLAGRDNIQLALRNALDTEEIDPEASKRDELFVPQKQAKPKTMAVKSSVRPKAKVKAPSKKTSARVLKAEPELRNTRLGLCHLTGEVLKQGLDVLGIETLEQM